MASETKCTACGLPKATRLDEIEGGGVCQYTDEHCAALAKQAALLGAAEAKGYARGLHAAAMACDALYDELRGRSVHERVRASRGTGADENGVAMAEERIRAMISALSAEGEKGEG